MRYIQGDIYLSWRKVGDSKYHLFDLNRGYDKLVGYIQLLDFCDDYAEHAEVDEEIKEGDSACLAVVFDPSSSDHEHDIAKWFSYDNAKSAKKWTSEQYRKIWLTSPERVTDDPFRKREYRSHIEDLKSRGII
jgi:hypothetical protein